MASLPPLQGSGILFCKEQVSSEGPSQSSQHYARCDLQSALPVVALQKDPLTTDPP